MGRGRSIKFIFRKALLIYGDCATLRISLRLLGSVDTHDDDRAMMSLTPRALREAIKQRNFTSQRKAIKNFHSDLPR